MTAIPSSFHDQAAKWFATEGVRNRTFTEEHARDSFENLLFGLCR